MSISKDNGKVVNKLQCFGKFVADSGIIIIFGNNHEIKFIIPDYLIYDPEMVDTKYSHALI